MQAWIIHIFVNINNYFHSVLEKALEDFPSVLEHLQRCLMYVNIYVPNSRLRMKL